MSNLARAVRVARAAHGVSQGELAKRIGSNQTTISDVETGKLVPTRRFVTRISNGLQLDPMVIEVLANASSEGEDAEWKIFTIGSAVVDLFEEKEA